MTDQAASPRMQRIASLKGFLPLSEETQATFSTRGQILQTVIRNHSFSESRRSSILRSRSVDRERRGSADSTDDGFLEIARMKGQQRNGHLHGLISSGGEAGWAGGDEREAGNRKLLSTAEAMTPQMRSQRLIGNSNPRYRWEQYWTSEEQLKHMKKSVRKYYERNNYLIQQYMYIDRLLDSSLPHSLIQEYHAPDAFQSTIDVPPTITEEASSAENSPQLLQNEFTNQKKKQQQQQQQQQHEEEQERRQDQQNHQQKSYGTNGDNSGNGKLTGPGQAKVKRTPRNLYKVPEEEAAPLLPPVHSPRGRGGGAGGYTDSRDPEAQPLIPAYVPEEDEGGQDRVVQMAIYINLAANTILLIFKIIVTVMTSSVSVLASLVDAALDFLSTAIVWTTTTLIARRNPYAYPAGRSRLEPIGVLIFSVVMVTSFVQVLIEAFKRLTGPEHEIVQLTPPAIGIMVGTVVIKGACWFYCRLIRNSSVQALAQDAVTDVIFNTFSIFFPLVGYYLRLWPLDPLGGLLLSAYVIVAWSRTSGTHIRNLTGAAASADERNVLLYLTMRFAKSIRFIQGLQAYHAGDKLNVEVDLVLEEETPLRDSHDLGESLQYVLESVPVVERAFVHLDYKAYNIPTHMDQHEE